MNTTYLEIQKFGQWWLWVLLMGLSAIPVYGLYQQVILGQPFGNNPMPNWGLVVFLSTMLLLLAFFKYLELRTEIDNKGIRCRLRPLSSEVFTWDQIQEVTLITYGFVGYGLRFSPKYGTVYNTSGNQGMSIILKNGGKFVVGTQNADGIKQTLNALKVSGVIPTEALPT